MKILFVTQFFFPENFRINDLARELVKRKHSVTVLTGQPNYPGGDIFPGYSACSVREQVWEGVRIIRVPVIPRKSGGLLLSLNYLSFVITAGLQAAFMDEKDFDVIYAFGTSPITQAIPALVMKKRTGAPVFINVQDLWPDNVIAITGLKNPLATGLLDKLVDGIYNGADVILGTSESFVKAIRRRKGLRNKRKVGFWPQYSTVSASDTRRPDLMEQGRFHLVFTGNVGYGQGLDMVIDAAALLKSVFEGRLAIHIFGDGRAKEELLSRTVEEGLGDMVIFHGSVPEEEVPGILNTADAALLILKKDPIFEKTIPAKLQTYLCCGCPTLVCARGESVRLVRRYSFGISTEEVDAVSLADAVKKLLQLDRSELQRMSKRAKKLSSHMFDKERLISELEHYMELAAK